MSYLLYHLAHQGSRPRLEPFPVPSAARSLDEISLALPAGAYTTLRTYYEGKRTLSFSQHVHRLEESAHLAGYPLRLDEEQVRNALRQILQETEQSGQDWRIRLTLDLEQSPGDLYIALEPLVPLPAEAYRQGVRALTCEVQRQNPQAKLTRFIQRAEAVRRSLPPGVHEAIMVSPEGYLLEGLSSNFYAVKEGRLYTAMEGVLAGVTRALVLECAQRLGLPLMGGPAHRQDIPYLEEAFISSSSRGVLPLSHIDEVPLASSRPGSVTRMLMEAYHALLGEKTEPI